AGAVPDRLMPEDLTLTVGGRVRPALWIRRVSRGPGAVADATARKARETQGTQYVAEPDRTILIVVDEASLPAGGHRQATEAAATFLDRLGVNDRVSVVRVPLASAEIPAPTAERPVSRSAINQIVGRMTPDAVRADGVTPDDRHVAGDPFGARASRGERPEREEPRVVGETPDGSLPAGLDSLDGLIRTLKAAARLPGRKTVVFFSSGLDGDSSARITEAVRVAAEARASVYIFGLGGTSDPRYSRLDQKLLDGLARSAGGLFVTAGRNPARVAELLAAELAACYQVAVERTDEDLRRGVLDLRVGVRRSDLVVRAPATVAVNAPATADIAPPAPAPAAPPEAVTAEAYRGSGRRGPTPPAPAAAAARGPAVDLVLGRLSDYALAYLGQYSAVVAEEDYRQDQRVGGRDRRLRADLLFVRAEPSRELVSFRDVFEVDGQPVRDRDSRLQDLFITPKPDAEEQLRSIKDESARYNVGPFERNINVPLYPLKLLLPANRSRFDFSVGRVTDTGGVKTWQLDFVERGRPTLVLDRKGEDIPLEGRFLVEQATGAVVETTLKVEQRDYSAAIVVRYVRDPKLGLWVPAEMKETYKVPDQIGTLGTVLECTARYKNFRRFQVSTDIQVIPK
ncbi:MAG: hypothetical protein Q7V01_06825, partial [Vicinamibacterales bacterium]|nr:hypothetical protein [Vicinamibacterales bacterium]